MHPINNTNIFKAFIFKSSTLKISIAFILFYFCIALVFTGVYSFIIDSPEITQVEILEYSLLSSFGFDADFPKIDSKLFFTMSLLHQILALVISTIFTAVIVLKFFFLRTFFVFKKKCNYEEGSDELTISLYNSVDLFVTDCRVRIYGREESIDANGAKALRNINANNPIFEKTYPFMEMHLATRLKVKLEKDDSLYKWLVEKKVEQKRLDLIIILEANVANIDSSVYEVYKYSIDSQNLQESIDFYGPNSIDLNYDNYSKSLGWDKFEK